MNGELESLQRKDKWTEEDKKRLWKLQQSAYKRAKTVKNIYKGPTVAETMSRIEKDFS